MNKWLSLKQLYYLITLYETRHFGEAARQCCVSQSTLSKGIQNLEDQFECSLYEKNGKRSRLVFTHLGEVVVKQGRELLTKSQDLLELGQLTCGKEMQGQLRLGAIPTIAPFLLSGLVHEVNKSFPDLTLLLREDTTVNLLAALEDGQLDVLILALPVDIGNLEFKILGRDQFKMVISESQLDNIKLPLHYSDLPDEFIFLLEKEHCLTEHAVSACNLTEKNKINSFSATSLHTLVQMVANGLGSTFIPQMAIDHGLLENQALKVIDPPGRQAYRDIGLVWRGSSPRTDTFIHLAEVIQKLLQK
ncbi:LysR family transcriptional regulator [Vibrio sp. UCD-FRSSP16_10]|uniref:hydrogen peroxide-inducible genes activator n=1 Tax=unclassified Vibrio TaxID=2614977 RepID=UPI0007FF412B|nr:MULTISPECIES: hydrogen peroxide-inducible genes activator [unclassified Vibrio]OBT06642.1 LysR family transcriptional regulator [Vibrio sp. UCD-FRSSP16_30]OBT12339.1 LysR family transcriptional regulator [Vibrio sp. UCD-FRSSP16_10]